jgi:16S rRNA (guanine527-N7)-methyltransferase
MQLADARARSQLASDYHVSRETMLNFERYQLLLLKWARRINLVGPSTLANFWDRHISDCAQLLPIMGSNTLKIADFGAGAGLPGLVLAALLKDRADGSHVTLVEASSKRCAFLREAARILDVRVTIINEKIEDVVAYPIDIVTARAFAPLDKLLSYSHPWAQLGARIVLLKGEDVQREIEEASTNWAFQSRIDTSVTDSRGCVVEILNLKPTQGK